MNENERFQRYKRASRTVAALRGARNAMAEMPPSAHLDDTAADLDQALADAEADMEVARRTYMSEPDARKTP